MLLFMAAAFHVLFTNTWNDGSSEESFYKLKCITSEILNLSIERKPHCQQTKPRKRNTWAKSSDISASSGHQGGEKQIQISRLLSLLFRDKHPTFVFVHLGLIINIWGKWSSQMVFKKYFQLANVHFRFKNETLLAKNRRKYHSAVASLRVSADVGVRCPNRVSSSFFRGNPR